MKDYSVYYELIAVLGFFVITTVIFYIRYIKTFKNESLLNTELASLKTELANYKDLKEQISDYEQIKNEKLNLLKDKEFLNKEIEKLSLSNNNLKSENNKIKSNLQDLLSSNSALSQKAQIFEENLKNLEIKYETMLKTLESNLKEQNEKNSKLIYEENTKVLIQNSNDLMEKIFKPLELKVNEYKENILKQSASIETNIKTMFETSQKLGQKADEFAKVLKGDKKARGDFGEMMLKRCLIASGLREGEHFSLQESFKDDENRHKRPDAIVYFEPNKCVIIDAKFSLPNDLNSPNYTKEVAENIIARINELSKKDYEKTVKNANEYVILFIPYQNIIDLALEAEPNLFQIAESKKIFLVSPTTLFMGLKMIYFGWKNYEINENVHNIFIEFGKFYDKFAMLYEDYEKLKKQSIDNFNKINTHLYGKGNIKNRLENLKKLGIKNTKDLPELKEDEFLQITNDYGNKF